MPRPPRTPTQPYDLRYADATYDALKKTRSVDPLVLSTLALLCCFQENAFLAFKNGDQQHLEEIEEMHEAIHDIIRPALKTDKKGYLQLNVDVKKLDVPQLHDHLSHLRNK